MVLKAGPQQCRVQGDNHFPSPAHYTISDTGHDAVGLLGHLGTLLAHVKPAIDEQPYVLFHQADFQPRTSKPVALHGIVVTQVQYLALGLVESHTSGIDPLIQPVQIPFLPSSRVTLLPNFVSSIMYRSIQCSGFLLLFG
ncbi:hypothetical protein llap_4503 [Limosa lapponica baueri]|uniref:Uncharacterized protein n=1 Tax=Limosa lapponica baueri TaxID=1758121 RepID=A0A2I0UGN3_LIMLA|nr:hypothetical protein llap_4503 [Limosa lapponica baueri]